MTAEQFVPILHGVGFLTGAALYAMLLSMVLPSVGRAPGRTIRQRDALAAVTAALGLIWNVGALALVTNSPPPLSMALAYAAFGLLPAVFIQVAIRSWSGVAAPRAFDRWLCRAAYLLGGGAAVLQVVEAIARGRAPSSVAFRILALGFVVLAAAMVFAAPAKARRSGSASWVLGVAVFAVSAWHLGQHEAGQEGWPAVVLGHHASIPLALAILWADFRFALADIFLKRALTLLVLMGAIVGLYLGLAGPHLLHLSRDRAMSPSPALLVLTLWAGTAIAYPVIRRVTGWFVDAVVLKRPNTIALRAEIARRLALSETAPEILESACALLGPALNSDDCSFEVLPEPPALSEPAVTTSSGPAELEVSAFVPTVDPPHYLLRFGAIGGGRRILSDDVALLEAVAAACARRLDALRWVHERCERDRREEEIAKLATEAELRALQAQLNPHFLFNALNTLGYLMKAAPDRARATLLDLTKLLRAVLKRSDGNMVTLGQEIALVESYLAIEAVRFEDRLRLRLDVPLSLRAIAVPPLLVQPLVENAIKHGIAPRKDGGEITIVARRESVGDAAPAEQLVIEVADTGVGASDRAVAAGRGRGLGLANIEKRLHAHYGERATLAIESRPGRGTRVILRLPVAATVRRAEAEVAAGSPA